MYCMYAPMTTPARELHSAPSVIHLYTLAHAPLALAMYDGNVRRSRAQPHVYITTDGTETFERWRQLFSPSELEQLRWRCASARIA
jgi:hypothetical protein